MRSCANSYERRLPSWFNVDAKMTRHRVRIRFTKSGDLRMISHLDLARVFERLFRRAGLELAMTEGFHPKAKLSFPSALSLGICGLDEILDVTLMEAAAADELRGRLLPHLPPGLALNSIRSLHASEKKAQPERFVYEIPLPDSRRRGVRHQIEKLLAQSSYFIERNGHDQEIDLRSGLEDLRLGDGVVCFTLRNTRTASIRPREVLAALGLADLEDDGFFLTRTAVDLQPPDETERTESTSPHEEGNVD